jgi:hypothetical protein
VIEMTLVHSARCPKVHRVLTKMVTQGRVTASNPLYRIRLLSSRTVTLAAAELPPFLSQTAYRYPKTLDHLTRLQGLSPCLRSRIPIRLRFTRQAWVSTEEPQPEQNVQVLLKRVKKLEETLDTVSRGNPAPQWTSLSSIDCAGSSTSFFGSHVKISVPELRGSVSKTRLFGQSHWMSAFEHVRHGQRHRTKVCLTDEVIVQTHLNFQK